MNATHIFLVTYSENICFTTNSHVVNRKVKSYWLMLKAVCLMYEARGLHIVKVKADLEFLPLRELVNELPTSPDTEFAAQGMHVGPVERDIRYNKEKARSLPYTLPFDKIPKVMLIHMMFNVTMVMNMFPRKGGNAIYSPQMIMTEKICDNRRSKYIIWFVRAIYKRDDATQQLGASNTRSNCVGHDG